MSVNERSVEVTREEAQNREEDRLPYVCVDNEVLHARDKQVGNFTIQDVACKVPPNIERKG